jgi:hypothetical protein
MIEMKRYVNDCFRDRAPCTEFEALLFEVLPCFNQIDASCNVAFLLKFLACLKPYLGYCTTASLCF